jgi:hypothetical protein
MPAGDVELQVEYYPGMLVKPTNLVGGTLSVEGLGLGTTSFTAPSEWDHNSTKLTSGHFEGFKSVTEEEAKAWPGVPATGKVALFYNYDETEQKWDMIYFKDGAISQNFKGEPQQLATIYNLTDFSFSVFYTTGMQMPAGFEKDDDGNIYVKKDTKFTVIAKPAEGYHLVGWSDDAENKELEREFTMTDDDFTVTATFSDEYNVALNAEGLSDEEAAAWKAATGTDQPAALPLENVKYGTEVKVTYTGTKKVLGVKAEKKAAAPAAPEYADKLTEATYSLPQWNCTQFDTYDFIGQVLTDEQAIALAKYQAEQTGKKCAVFYKKESWLLYFAKSDGTTGSGDHTFDKDGLGLSDYDTYYVAK